ncbi:patatin-like phospholipase family protein [Polluticaenibacter yanchengensis]|uniref:Patatin-like phospholipase family protein n=1 Tax=Polluticaenibacter yanchengensis TaxID=3014562 RepID=A0ABT4UGG8_9BACT|nr:patatin-like phospholipase family protein [Chitinophagaceae bacterium LY-5]
MKKKFLCIDGGGSRGIIPATIMDCVFNDTGVHPREAFDLLAGTSTGGIISIAYAFGVPTSVLVDLYLKKVREIFHENFLDRAQTGDEIFQANYKNRNFEIILKNIFGEATLGTLQSDNAFGGKDKDLMVCSFDLSPDVPNDDNKNYRPLVVHSNYIRDKDIKLYELALMTSAGPTYFPIYKKKYIDGGVALNNPSMAAVSYAINNGKDEEKMSRYPDGVKKGLELGTNDIELLSLSTGTSNKTRIEESVVKNGNWGKLKWLGYLPDLLTEANMQSTKYYVKQILNDDQYCRIEAYFDKSPNPLLNNPKLDISMDTKQENILLALHEYAIEIYNKNKSRILKFIEG